MYKTLCRTIFVIVLIAVFMAGTSKADVFNNPPHGHVPKPPVTTGGPAAPNAQHQHRTGHVPERGVLAHGQIPPYRAFATWQNDRTYHPNSRILRRASHRPFAHGHQDVPARYHIHPAVAGGDITPAEAAAWNAGATARVDEAFQAWVAAGTGGGDKNWPGNDNDHVPGTGVPWHSSVNWERVESGDHEVHIILGEAGISAPMGCPASALGCWDYFDDIPGVADPPGLNIIIDDDTDMGATTGWYYGLDAAPNGRDGIPGNSDDVDPSKIDFATIILHEVGHVIGLEHFGTFPVGAIMQGTGFTHRAGPKGILRTIDASAKHGVLDLYTIPERAHEVCHGLLDTDHDGTLDCLDTDDDNDTVLDEVDNCPLMSNPAQTDTDGDRLGDACDPDDDDDTVLDGVDNCPLTFNTAQADTDRDGFGDACDPDDDNDTVLDAADNCPLMSNTDQTNTDGDGFGDACDPDDDNDTVLDGVDNCPLMSNTDQTNTDGDGFGDACDPDDDGDGISDKDEVALGSDPLNRASTPEVCDGVDNDLNGSQGTAGPTGAVSVSGITGGTGSTLNGFIDEGFPDTDLDGMADCVDPEVCDGIQNDPSSFNVTNLPKSIYSVDVLVWQQGLSDRKEFREEMPISNQTVVIKDFISKLVSADIDLNAEAHIEVSLNVNAAECSIGDVHISSAAGVDGSWTTLMMTTSSGISSQRVIPVGPMLGGGLAMFMLIEAIDLAIDEISAACQPPVLPQPSPMTPGCRRSGGLIGGTAKAGASSCRKAIEAASAKADATCKANTVCTDPSSTCAPKICTPFASFTKFEDDGWLFYCWANVSYQCECGCQ